MGTLYTSDYFYRLGMFHQPVRVTTGEGLETRFLQLNRDMVRRCLIPCMVIYDQPCREKEKRFAQNTHVSMLTICSQACALF